MTPTEKALRQALDTLVNGVERLVLEGATTASAATWKKIDKGLELGNAALSQEPTAEPHLQALKEIANLSTSDCESWVMKARWIAERAIESVPEPTTGEGKLHKPDCPTHFGGGCETPMLCVAYRTQRSPQ